MKLYEIEQIENGFVVHYVKLIQESVGGRDQAYTKKIWCERFYTLFDDAVDFISKYQAEKGRKG